MFTWIKEHKTILITILATVGIIFYLYACESKVKSLDGTNHLIDRQELQLQLNHFIDTAQLRFASLDRQDKIRAIILQNALVLIQGQPFNPIGIITAAAAVYGVSQGGQNITKVVKEKRKKRKVNNGES